MSPEPAPGYPFDRSGLVTDDRGVRQYADRPPTLVAMLRASADRSPMVDALVHGGTRLRYEQLWERAARVAGGLRRDGVRSGDRVVLQMPNGLDWCVGFFGIQLVGAVAVPVNPRLTASESGYITRDAGAARTLAQGGALPDGPPVVADDAAPDDLAAIFYTSGTTGRPKGAMTSHRNFLANTETARRVLRLSAAAPPRTLIAAPLFHVTGCNSQLLPTCELGGTAVLLDAFQPAAFLRAVAQEEITMLMAAPAMYAMALRVGRVRPEGVASVRSLSYGGAPVPGELVRALAEAFPRARLGNGFGLTETSSFATYLPHEDALRRSDSVGHAVPPVDLRLAALERDDAAGELLVRGPNVVGGYWGDPARTAATFADGWLRTGDVARIGPDGLVQVVDRVKDVINRAGENVYSVEVEHALGLHPAVAEVAVVAVPDELAGEKVGAVLVPHPGAALDPSAVVAAAAEHLAAFKLPQYVAVRPEPLPRNPGGKVLKAELRARTAWSVARRRRTHPSPVPPRQE